MTKIRITEKQAKKLGLIKPKIVKITKEQYNRLFANGLIKEELGSAPSVNNSELGDIKGETLELIKYLYRKSEDLSPFWEQHGLKYDDICKTLVDKGLIISKNGKYELSKKSGTPENAIKVMEDELRNLIGESPELETEDAGGYPTGADQDSNAPWKQTDTKSKAVEPKMKLFEVIYYNSEIAILKKTNGELYVFYYGEVNKNDLANYAERQVTNVTKGDDGLPDTEYSEDFEIDGYVIEGYINDNLKHIHQGVGVSDYEKGVPLVKIDEPLKADLLSIYDKDRNLVNILGNIQEMTGAASSGAFTAPMGMTRKEMPISSDGLDVPVVNEINTAGAGHFQYDTNALPDVGRNGEFKNHKKTKAEKSTQYAGGSFVKFNDCVKYNNKPAGVGCSQGAVDGVVTTTKTKSNINAPSLSKLK